MVNSTPMQQPIKPTIEAIDPTTNKPNRTKGCLDTIIILVSIASMASNFPKMISGIIIMVNNENAIVSTKPSTGI